ncbi:MAG: bamB [Herbaspirillum sp.]|jgi:outer membrane protein assembly factor BamB|nr:bamB [Herbaspirillum sp.]
MRGTGFIFRIECDKGSNMRTGFKYCSKYICVGAVVLLSGCSMFSWFSKKPVNPPAPLAELKATKNVHTLWKVSVPKSETYQFSPALAADSVYAAGADGTIVRINVKSGQTDWRINAKMKLTAGVGSDGATVAVVGEKGVVLAYDNAGKLLWKGQASSEVLSAPAVGSGLVIVRSLDNRIAAFDALTGVRRWMAERNTPSLTLRSAPGIAIVSSTAFVALPGGRLSALTLTNGGPIWEVQVGDPRGTTEMERVADVSGMPAVLGNDVCVVTYQSRIGCFDTSSGGVRWVKAFSSSVGVSVDARYVFAADESGTVTEFERATGAALWSNDKLSYRQLSAPASVGSTVALGDYQGYIHFLSQADGSFVGRVPTDGSAITANPVVAGSSVIFQTQAGTVVALAAE